MSCMSDAQVTPVECLCRVLAHVVGPQHGYPSRVPVHRDQRSPDRDLYARLARTSKTTRSSSLWLVAKLRDIGALVVVFQLCLGRMDVSYKLLISIRAEYVDC